MFTGIVTELGVLKKIDGEADKVFFISAPDLARKVAIGSSVACNGVCLTVTSIAEDILSFDVSGETLRVTTLGALAVGDYINLEGSLKAGDELGGHIVTGHVDCAAILEQVEEDGRSYVCSFSHPVALSQFIAPKGSVTLDGVSLTVNHAEAGLFKVNIIPHTWEKTRFQTYKTGDKINLEADVLARYAVNRLQYQSL